jgi:hypothetical protein
MLHAKKTSMKTLNIFLLLLISTFINSCSTPKHISTIESNTYDEKNNQTTFNILPFGSLTMQGKWTQFSYNQISFQHNFRNADSVIVAVAINQTTSYPFNKPNLTPNEFVKDFYEWDSKYLSAQINGSRNITKQDTINHYIIWQITADNEKYKVDNHYLFGCENGISFTVFVSTPKWTNDQKENFIESVYRNKTVGKCCK